MVLRDYQAVDLDSLRALFRQGYRAPVYVAPCGSGKTTTCSEIIRGAVKKDGQVIFMAQLRTLINQCSDRLNDLGIDHGIIMSGSKCFNPTAPVQVCSRDTLVGRLRKTHVPAQLLIVDECHHAASSTYREIFTYYKDARRVGLTATPIRRDGQGLGGELFDSMHCSLSPRELTERGYLVPGIVYAPSAPDLDAIPIQSGDYHKSKLAEVCMKPTLIGNVVEHWLKLAKGRRTIQFTVSREHSRKMTEAYWERGVRATHLDATSNDSERKEALRKLRDRELDVVLNVGLFYEGADFPWVECISLTAPSRSLSRYIQEVGRGARSSPGKTCFLVLDHADVTRQHGFLTDDREWSLDASPNRVRRGSVPTKFTVRMCNECYRAYGAEEKACPSCGSAKVKQCRSIEEKKGNLVELKKIEKKKDGLSSNPRIRELQQIARKFGYKPGWLWRNMQLIQKGEDPEIPERARKWISEAA